MDRMPWFKWWNGTAADPKLRMIADEHDVSVAVVIGVWAYLLEKASTSAERGVLPDDLDYKLMAYTLKLEPFDVETVCNAMKRGGLVTPDGEIVKWEERQAKRERGEPPGASTKRVQQMRLRQKEQKNKDLGDKDQIGGNVTGETDETAGNATKHPKKKRREEEEKEESKPKTTSPAGAGDAEGSVDPFDTFWDAYPLKVGKKTAHKAWIKLKPDEALQGTILAAIEAQKAGDQWMRDNGKAIPHPTTWLNGERWTDAVRPYVKPAPKLPAGWWESPDLMKEAGLMLDPPLKPGNGEGQKAFAHRIRVALGQVDPEATGGLMAAPPTAATYVPPMLEDPAAPPPPIEDRRARLAALKEATGIKTAKQLQEEQGAE